jgi:hypothetical protein
MEGALGAELCAESAGSAILSVGRTRGASATETVGRRCP